jgi:diaminopimelate epimerase
LSRTKWISKIASRRTGIGSEGILLIQKSRKADFRMRFINPDGSEVDMCGNGARCIARLAHDIGAAPAKMSIETRAGILHAEMAGNLVRLHMTTPKDWRMKKTLVVGKKRIGYNFVNSGVPHVVVTVDDLDRQDVAGMGSAIRYHRDFAPKGTNANFIQITGPDSLRIRTYERGVEAETLACGTGIVASALVSGMNGDVTAPVRVTCASGDVLQVGFVLRGSGAQNVTLLGPAVHVFQGAVVYP